MRKFKAFNEEEQPAPEEPVLGIGIRGFISQLRSLRLSWGTGAKMILVKEGEDESGYHSVKNYNVNTPGKVYLEFGRSKNHVPGDPEWYPPLCNMLALLIRERYDVTNERFEDKTIWVRNKENESHVYVGYVIGLANIAQEHNNILITWRSL